MDASGISNPQSVNSLPFSFATASISDASGNLLFVTNGGTILDRDLLVMPAVANVNLRGDTGKVMIHQIPGSSRYYVFYGVNNLNYWRDRSTWTWKYAIVDMQLRGGKGDVVSYDQVIETKGSPTFTIAAGQRPDEAWLVTHRMETDSFFVYKIDAGGLSKIPVISKAGSNKVTRDYIFSDLKASYDGSMVAGYTYSNNSGDFAVVWCILEVFWFDGTTGVMTSRIRTLREFTYFYNFMSLEFSPDSRLIYLGRMQRIPGLQPCGFGNSEILQFDLCHTDTTAFYESGYRVLYEFNFCYPESSHGQLSLGADKTIYIPYTTGILSQIRYPNRRGASCGYVKEAYRLFDWRQRVAWPVQNTTVLRKMVQNNIVYEGSCFPNPYTFRISNSAATVIAWDFGDPLSGANTSTLQAPQHTFSRPGRYKVRVSFTANGETDTIEDLVEVADPGSRLLSGYPMDTVICGTPRNKIGVTPVVNALTKWYQKTDEGSVYNVRGADSILPEKGKWYVEMRQSDCGGCIKRDSITVTILDAADVDLGPDRSVCSYDSVKITLPVLEGANYLWSNGSVSNEIVIRQSGSYSVSVSIPGVACIVRDTATFNFLPPFEIMLPSDTTLCTGEELLLQPSVYNTTLLWNGTYAGASYKVTTAGKYWVEAFNANGCMSSDTIVVNYSTAVKPNLGPDTAICSGKSISLDAQQPGRYTWSNGQSTKIISVSTAGTYWVSLNNGICATKDTVTISVQSPPYLELGRDTSLCQGDSYVLDARITGAKYKWSDASTQQQLKVSAGGKYYLELTAGVCTVSDTVNVVQFSSPSIALGPDIILCSGDSVSLRAPGGFASYQWSNGKTGQEIFIQTPGFYHVTATTLQGCKARDTMELLQPFPKPVLELGPSGPICAGTAKRLDAGTGFTSYKWSDGSTGASINVKDIGTYWVQIIDRNRCRAADTVKITSILPLPENYLGADTSVCRYDKITLSSNAQFSQYQWSNGSNARGITISAPGIYWLKVKNTSGCNGTDTIVVSPKECFTGINIPNAFTPGSDGKNDRFRPIIGAALSKYLFTVYNRFGEVVYSSSDPAEGWDGSHKGQPQPMGGFTWKLVYTLDGGLPQLKKGTVLLIR